MGGLVPQMAGGLCGPSQTLAYYVDFWHSVGTTPFRNPAQPRGHRGPTENCVAGSGFVGPVNVRHPTGAGPHRLIPQMTPSRGELC